MDCDVQDEVLFDVCDDASQDETFKKSHASATMKVATRLANELRPKERAAYQTWNSLTVVAPDPYLLHQRAVAAGTAADQQQLLHPQRLSLRGASFTFVVWHWIELLGIEFHRKGLNGYPPCPHCFNLPSHGKVTGHKWNSSLVRVLDVGKTDFCLPYQYKCVNCPAKQDPAAQNSFFLATDPKVLSIMADMGLTWALNMLPMVKDQRLGIGPGLHRLITRGLVRTANLKDTVDAVEEVDMDTYLTKQLGYYDYCRTLQACKVKQVAAGAEPVEDAAQQPGHQQQQQPQSEHQQQQQPGHQQQQRAPQQQQHTGNRKQGQQTKAAVDKQRTLFQLPGMVRSGGTSSPAGMSAATATEAGPSGLATARAASVTGGSQQAAAAVAAAAAPAVAGVASTAAPAPASAATAAAAAAAADHGSDAVGEHSPPDVAVTWNLQAFPDRTKLHGGTFSQGFITRRIMSHWEPRQLLARAVIHSARGRRIAMDYQFYPCKMVRLNKDKAATAIFNMVDVETGAVLIHAWTQSLEFDAIRPLLDEYAAACQASNDSLPDVAYVDDPRLFLGVKSVMPTLQMVQDGFHLIDRFSRAIPATNTLKASFIAELTDIIYQEEQDDVKKVKDKLAAKGQVLSDQSKQWRRARIRRYVKSGDELGNLIKALVSKYTTLICPVDGVSLVTEELHAVFKNASDRNIKIDDILKSPLDLMQDRLPLSELYSCKGKDGDGLELWSCHRGTSGEEGMHGHLNKLFKGGNYAYQLAQVMLEHWFLRWNLNSFQKSERWRSKFNNYGTYDIMLLQQVKAAAAAAAGFEDLYPEWQPVQHLQKLPMFGLESAGVQLQSAVPEDEGDDQDGLHWEPKDIVDVDEPQPSHKLSDMPADTPMGMQTGDLLPCKVCKGNMHVFVPEDRSKAVCRACGSVVLDLQEENGVLDHGSADMQVDNGVREHEPPPQAAAAAAAAGSSAAAAADSSAAAAAGSSAAAAAAAASAGSNEGRKRKVGPSDSTAKRVRLLHGRCEKKPAARYSVLHLAAPIETPQESRLFWELYSRYTRGGSTQWVIMQSVWNHRANINMARGDFSITLKHQRHSKEYHRNTTRSIAVQANMAAHLTLGAANLSPLAPRLGLLSQAPNPVPAPGCDMLLPQQVPPPRAGIGAAGNTTTAAAIGATGDAARSPPVSRQRLVFDSLNSIARKALGALSPRKVFSSTAINSTSASSQQQQSAQAPQQQQQQQAAAQAPQQQQHPAQALQEHKQQQAAQAFQQQQQQQLEQPPQQQEQLQQRQIAQAFQQQQQQQSEQPRQQQHSTQAPQRLQHQTVQAVRQQQSLPHQQQSAGAQKTKRSNTCKPCADKGMKGVYCKDPPEKHHASCWRRSGKHQFQQGAKVGQEAATFRGKKK